MAERGEPLKGRAGCAAEGSKLGTDAQCQRQAKQDTGTRGGEGQEPGSSRVETAGGGQMSRPAPFSR